MVAFKGMIELRDHLAAANRMFPSDKKAVRGGDVMTIEWAASNPNLLAEESDVPFVPHSAVIVVRRRSDTRTRNWYRDTYAAAALEVPGVLAVSSYVSLLSPELAMDLWLVDGDVAQTQENLREGVAHHEDAEIELDAAFEQIDLLRYPWAAAMRSSTLPATVA
jgi:hypothetical protein